MHQSSSEESTTQFHCPPDAGPFPNAIAASRPSRDDRYSRRIRPPSRRGCRCRRSAGAPLGDRVQRRILQQLRRRPFDKCVRRLAELQSKLLDEARLADAGLADDLDELPLASRRPLPAPAKEVELLLAPVGRPLLASEGDFLRALNEADTAVTFGPYEGIIYAQLSQLLITAGKVEKGMEWNDFSAPPRRGRFEVSAL